MDWGVRPYSGHDRMPQPDNAVNGMGFRAGPTAKTPIPSEFSTEMGAPAV